MSIKKFFYQIKTQVGMYLMLKNNINEIYQQKQLGNSLEFIQILKKNENLKPAQQNSELKYLLDIIEKNQCRKICEIGTDRGGSLFLFCQVAPSNARIISIDIHYPISRRFAFQKFIHKHQRLTCLQANTHEPETEIRIRKLLENELFDFIFIDGDHSFLGVMDDFIRFRPLIKKGGIIAVHDIHPDLYRSTGVKTNAYVGGVPEFWAIIKKSFSKTDEFIENFNQDGCGIGIIINE